MLKIKRLENQIIFLSFGSNKTKGPIEDSNKTKGSKQDSNKPKGPKQDSNKTKGPKQDSNKTKGLGALDTTLCGKICQ
jgi:hypothetical protein